MNYRYSFQNDYSEGAHPKVMQALLDTNLEQTTGYGTDPHCAAAAGTLRGLLKREDADVHFMVGGTQANLAVIGCILRPYQAVVSADTGHINTHEAGAVEATGHKVLTAPSADGKLIPEAIEKILAAHHDEHMVQPKMVYLSHPTELGTLYTLQELEGISRVCRDKGLYLYLDGARLSSALAAEGNDISLPDLARLTDGFYLGGTKCGALFGEALVLLHPALKQDFRYTMKQRGALLAKGRAVGVQFEALFRDGLYEQLGHHANGCADLLRASLKQAGYPFLVESKSNQVFPILPDPLVKALAEEYLFEIWGNAGEGKTAIRLVTSWATDEAAVRTFGEVLQQLSAAL